MQTASLRRCARLSFSLLFFLWLTVFGARAAAPQESPSKPDEHPVPVVVEEKETIFRVQNSGVVQTAERVKIHILSEEGRQLFGQVGLPYR